MTFSIGEAAMISGVSVRTLRYYDEIGLFHPSETTEVGYRLYNEAGIAHLQQILFYRELGLPLLEIKRILSQPDYDSRPALRRHRDLLLLKRRRLDEMLRLVGGILEGEAMSKPKITETDIREVRKKYAEEVRRRWGGTEAYRESEGRKDAPLAAAAEEAGTIFAAFAAARGGDPGGPEAAALTARWQAHITQHYYNCTKEILAGLGEAYVGDGRFTENIDSYGEGTAAFISAAIKAFCAD